MPRLTFFVACEKAIIERSDSTLSIITVFQEITADLNAKIDKDARAAHKWQVVSVWKAETGDDGKRFQQRVRLTNPDGAVAMEALAEFEMLKPFHRTVGRISQFPVGTEGEYALTIAVREIGQEQWKEAGIYPILVIHKIVKTPTSQ